MSGTLRIIPYVHVKPAVYDATHNELKYCDYCAAGKAAKKQTSCFHFYVCNVNEHICKSACQSHCPVCESAKYDLDKTVNNCSEQIDERVFFYFFQIISPIYNFFRRHGYAK